MTSLYLYLWMCVTQHISSSSQYLFKIRFINIKSCRHANVQNRHGGIICFVFVAVNCESRFYQQALQVSSFASSSQSILHQKCNLSSKYHYILVRGVTVHVFLPNHHGMELMVHALPLRIQSVQMCSHCQAEKTTAVLQLSSRSQRTRLCI